MKKFEYISFDKSIDDSELNKLGEEGWELVTHTALLTAYSGQQYYVFKREKIVEKPEIHQSHENRSSNNSR